MLKVRKKEGKTVKAYRLGDESKVIRQLIKEGKVKQISDKEYEVFTLEAVTGKSGHGQIAKTGDYIKIDADGNPYPNTAEYFNENHQHIKGDVYMQLSKPLNAWRADMPMCKEVRYLEEEKGLVLDPQHPANYFSAPLWGTQESADKDAWLVFYEISYDEAGNVTDASFNFVADNIFQQTYDVIGSDKG